MSTLDARLKAKQYEQTVVDFLNNKGHIICATDDTQFTTLLRTTMLKQLGQTIESLSSTSDVEQVLRIVREVSSRKHAFLLILERMIAGKNMGYLVRQLKNAYPDLRIIVLTSETDRQRLVLMHETGADNFITKPVSINGLIEKIAYTVKPQGKLGQLIEQARNFLVLNNPQNALKVCKVILDLKPNSAAAFLIIGDAMRELGKPERAREAYEEASKHAEMYLEPLRKLADLHGELGDMPNRLLYLEKLDKLSPLNVERKLDMGEIHLRMGNNEVAGQLFDSAVTVASKEAMAHISEVATRVAEIYEEKDPAQSEKYLRRALDAKGAYLSREDIATFNQLGITLRNQGKWREAIVEYKKALKVAPDDENLYYNMGMACAEGRDFKESKSYMSKAMSMNRGIINVTPNIAYNIALIYIQTGDREVAMECLTAALQQDPNFELAKTAIASLR